MKNQENLNSDGKRWSKDGNTEKTQKVKSQDKDCKPAAAECSKKEGRALSENVERSTVSASSRQQTEGTSKNQKETLELKV